MRLAVLQAAATADATTNLTRLDAALAQAAGAGADLLVSPELFTTGYAMDASAGAGAVQVLAAASARHHLAHAFSLPVTGGIGAVVADAGGRVLGTYRKVHLWGEGERAAFTAGDDAPVVVDVAGVAVGVAICFDVEFPETARAAALAGAQLLVVPTAMDDARVAEVLLPARALENTLVLAYANHTGNGFCGASVVLGADGAVLARAGEVGDDLLLVDVAPAEITAARARYPYLSDRRPGAYTGWGRR